MIIVGLTGGIGSGKTTVGIMFAALGIPVYNSDERAKELMESSPSVIKAIKKLLGEKAYIGEKLNKTYISKGIFNSKELLQQLNSIVHPAVRKDFLTWSEQQKAPYVIQEAAIIFEIGSQDFYDKIVLVTAPQKEKIARLMGRDAGNTEKDIKARMENQLDDATKITASDYIIENRDLEKTKAEVLRVHLALLDNS